MNRKLIAVCLIMLLLLVVTACENNDPTEEELFQQALDTVLEQMGMPDLLIPGDESPPIVLDSATDEIIETIDLGLLINMRQNTFSSRQGFRISDMRINLDGNLQIAEGDEWHTIDYAVRTFKSFYTPSYRSPDDRLVAFYIREDNTLWGFGSNRNGILGDGTGVDRDEPIQILDNVVSVYVFGHTTFGVWAFALQTDGTLLAWGEATDTGRMGAANDSGSFYPTPIAANVARVIGFEHSEARRYYLTFQTDTGYIYRLLINNNTKTLALPSAVIDVPYMIARMYFLHRDSQWIDYINSENILVRQYLSHRILWGARQMYGFVEWNFEESEQIATGVQRVFSTEQGQHTFFITLAGNLYGMGINTNGELGDGTRVPRTDPVMIAEDVIYARPFMFLQSNGTLWEWDQNDPTPQQTHTNVAAVSGDFIHFHDGRLLIGNREYDNVRVPRTITFD